MGENERFQLKDMMNVFEIKLKFKYFILYIKYWWFLWGKMLSLYFWLCLQSHCPLVRPVHFHCLERKIQNPQIWTQYIPTMQTTCNSQMCQQMSIMSFKFTKCCFSPKYCRNGKTKATIYWQLVFMCNPSIKDVRSSFDSESPSYWLLRLLN